MHRGRPDRQAVLQCPVLTFPQNSLQVLANMAGRLAKLAFTDTYRYERQVWLQRVSSVTQIALAADKYGLPASSVLLQRLSYFVFLAQAIATDATHTQPMGN